jgi:DNA (cytosine-5)-methyltransferase 1
MGARRGLRVPNYPRLLDRRTTVWEAIGDLPDADGFDELSKIDEVRAKWKTKALYAQCLRGLALDAMNFGYSREFDSNILTSSLRTEHTELSKQRFMATEHGKTEPISRFRKLPPDGLCNTLRAGTDSARGAFTSPRPIHPFLPRVITVREAARLHSYPDWFRFHKTKWHGFRQIGNSVPPLLGRAVASEIVKALGFKPRKPKEVLQPGDVDLLSLDMSSASLRFQVPRNTIAQRLRKPNSNQQDLWEESYV